MANGNNLVVRNEVLEPIYREQPPPVFAMSEPPPQGQDNPPVVARGLFLLNVGGTVAMAIERRTSDPEEPIVGQLWLRVDNR